MIPNKRKKYNNNKKLRRQRRRRTNIYLQRQTDVDTHKSTNQKKELKRRPTHKFVVLFCCCYSAHSAKFIISLSGHRIFFIHLCLPIEAHTHTAKWQLLIWIDVFYANRMNRPLPPLPTNWMGKWGILNRALTTLPFEISRQKKKGWTNIYFRSMNINTRFYHINEIKHHHNNRTFCQLLRCVLCCRCCRRRRRIVFFTFLLHKSNIILLDTRSERERELATRAYSNQ